MTLFSSEARRAIKETHETVADPLAESANVLVSQLAGILEQGDVYNAAVSASLLSEVYSRRPLTPGHKEVLPVILTNALPKPDDGIEEHHKFLAALAVLSPHLTPDVVDSLTSAYSEGTHKGLGAFADIATYEGEVEMLDATGAYVIYVSKREGKKMLPFDDLPEIAMAIRALGDNELIGGNERLVQTLTKLEPAFVQFFDRLNHPYNPEKNPCIGFVDAIVESCLAQPTEQNEQLLLGILSRAADQHKATLREYYAWLYETVAGKLRKTTFIDSQKVYKAIMQNIKTGSNSIAVSAAYHLIKSKMDGDFMYNLAMEMCKGAMDSQTRKLMVAAAAIANGRGTPLDEQMIEHVRAFDTSGREYRRKAAADVQTHLARMQKKKRESGSGDVAKRETLFRFTAPADVRLEALCAGVATVFLEDEKRRDLVYTLARFPFSNDRQRARAISTLRTVFRRTDREAIGFAAAMIDPQTIPFLLKAHATDAQLKQGVLDALHQMPVERAGQSFVPQASLPERVRARSGR